MSEDTPLRQFRKETLDISVTELAKRLGLSKASVSRMEYGKQRITVDLLRRVASYSDDAAAKSRLTHAMLLPEDAAQ